MTTTYQLMAAAFCLFGVLFLLYVDPVNSLTCKSCDQYNPKCFSGEVEDDECDSHITSCLTAIFRVTNGPSRIFRGCYNQRLSGCQQTDPETKVCYTNCQTDSCNNEVFQP